MLYPTIVKAYREDGVIDCMLQVQLCLHFFKNVDYMQFIFFMTTGTCIDDRIMACPCTSDTWKPCHYLCFVSEI